MKSFYFIIALEEDASASLCQVFHVDQKYTVVTSVYGEGLDIKLPGSDVRVQIPKGEYGTLKGYVECDPTHFLEHIPESECLVAPIADFTFSPFTAKLDTYAGKMKICLKHTVNNQENLKYLRVRKGNIQNGGPFEIIPRKVPAGSGGTYWEADTNDLIITARHCTQFICTSCKRNCDNNLQAFMTGAMKTTGQTKFAEARLFLCPSLYRIEDYKSVRFQHSHL